MEGEKYVRKGSKKVKRIEGGGGGLEILDLTLQENRKFN